MRDRYNKLLVILCLFFILSSALSMMTAAFSSREDEKQIYLVETKDTKEMTVLDMMDTEIIDRVDDHSGETTDIPLFTGYDPVIHQNDE